jgi:[ribosomal protein S18]-alanine N-acetyltransferase
MILEFSGESASHPRRLYESLFLPMAGVEIRDADDADLDGLNALEGRSFASDRMARRNIRRLIDQKSASLRVAAGKDGVHGYHLVLFRKDSSIARLYSIAVDDRRRGAGLGRRLLADAEAVAAARRKRALRLEVREDNLSAIRLYERRGYRLIGRYARYYADKADALRYEKPLAGSGEDRSSAATRKKRRS